MIWSDDVSLHDHIGPIRDPITEVHIMSIVVRFSPTALTGQITTRPFANSRTPANGHRPGSTTTSASVRMATLRSARFWNSREQFEAFGERPTPIPCRRRHPVHQPAGQCPGSQHHQGLIIGRAAGYRRISSIVRAATASPSATSGRRHTHYCRSSRNCSNSQRGEAGPRPP